MAKKTTEIDLDVQMFFFLSATGFKSAFPWLHLQHYVVRETTQIYKTMIALDSYISFASIN